MVRHGARVHTTFSAGVAEMAGNESLDELVARADVALYEAKRAGRDRVIAAAAGR
jgi:PleD family two-component response regulator